MVNNTEMRAYQPRLQSTVECTTVKVYSVQLFFSTYVRQQCI